MWNKIPVVKYSFLSSLAALGILAGCSKGEECFVPEAQNSSKTRSEISLGDNNINSRISLEDQIKAYKAFFGINSNIIGIYSPNGVKNYFNKDILGTTLFCDRNDMGYWGTVYISNSNVRPNALQVAKLYSSKPELNSYRDLMLVNDTIYEYNDDGFNTAKYYKKGSDFFVNNGASEQKFYVNGHNAFPTPISFDVGISEPDSVLVEK